VAVHRAAHRVPQGGPAPGDRPPGPGGGLNELGAGELAQIDDALLVGAYGQVGRLPGLTGQRLKVRSGQFVERILAQRGGGELSQARPRLIVAVLVAADHLSRRERGQQARGGTRGKLRRAGKLTQRAAALGHRREQRQRPFHRPSSGPSVRHRTKTLT
jgi:hypothetical protein